MNQSSREIRKTTKLKYSLKQKTKLKFRLPSTIIFLALLLPSFLALRSPILKLLEQKSTRGNKV